VYNASFLFGTITVDNSDGTYNVQVKGRPQPYGSVGTDGGKYAVGDSVNLFFPDGDRGMPQICQQSAYK
jgi:hypothetical protein